MQFETQVGASVVGRSAGEYTAQSGSRESSEGAEEEISAPVQVKAFQIFSIDQPELRGVLSEIEISD
jgi:hypothetical protein